VCSSDLPSALEEIQGIARGSGLDYRYAFFAATRDGMRLPPEPSGECTSVYCGPATTRGGKVLIGQTKDTSAPLDRYRIQRLAYADGRRAVILNYPGWIANLCLTSDGLSFTGNSLFANGPRDATVPFSLLKRLILERSSVDEVLQVARRHTFENAALTIADARGRAVSWEGAAGRVTVRDVSTEAFSHANSVLCPSLRPEERPQEVVPCSGARQRNVQEGLDRIRGRIEMHDLTALFADHTDFPTSICRHGGDGLPGATTAAFVADLTARSMRIAIGNPCVAGFVEYGLDF
jgi:isopenicillin-N N-acyltransferase-like protein